MHQYGGLRDAKPGTTVLFRHRDAQPAPLNHRLPELARKFTGAVMFQPVSVIEACTHTANRLVYGALIVG